MILVDSSVWIDHLRTPHPSILQLAESELLLTHPFVIGEVAMGSIRDRADVLRQMAELPLATIAADLEVLKLIEDRALFSLGIGYLDAHLLASALLTDGSRLWTFDRRLLKVASTLKLNADLPQRLRN